MSELLLAIGLVAVIEGLVLALAPNRLEEALRVLAQIKPEARRLLGLCIISIGVLIVWVVRSFLS